MEHRETGRWDSNYVLLKISGGAGPRFALWKRDGSKPPWIQKKGTYILYIIFIW